MFYDPIVKEIWKDPIYIVGGKNNRIQWEDLIPAIALYAGANFDFVDNPLLPYQETTISPKVVLSTQNNFVGSFVLVTNILRIG